VTITDGRRHRVDHGPGAAIGRHGPVRIALGFQPEPDTPPTATRCPTCDGPKAPADMACSVWCRQQVWRRQTVGGR
jgi:hypothetical protein